MTNQEKIQHLYWRAGFGLSPNDQDKHNWSVTKAVNNLFKEAQKLQPLAMPKFDSPSRAEIKSMSKQERKDLRKEVQQMTNDVNADWVRQMASTTSSPLQEKMTLFWHGHFACESKSFHLAVNQINTIRKHSLGSFKDLVLAISKDASMIFYLNNQQNKKSHPNENYARELMELFTIGRGNYTEKDIKEAARAFTGWFANRQLGTFNFRDKAHDYGKKTFMGKTGNFDGTDIVDIILEQKETAEYIATKVYRYFVNPKPNTTHITAIAKVFRDSDYDIAKMMRYVFESDWFYSQKNRGSKIKSPIEFLVGISKTLGLSFGNTQSLLFPQRTLGQTIFRPPNVAGWPGGKAWIDNATLMLRLNFAGIIFQRSELLINAKEMPEMAKRGKLKKLAIDANLQPLLQTVKKIKEADLSNTLCQQLLQVDFESKDSFIEQFAKTANTRQKKIQAFLLGIMSLPEYQVC
ncbi:MAG: DUF1800 domain-containing protein [Aureispira sp.]|nr:DUF1800 domain-containing protein [Aureispira sp.]